MINWTLSSSLLDSVNEDDEDSSTLYSVGFVTLYSVLLTELNFSDWLRSILTSYNGKTDEVCSLCAWLTIIELVSSTLLFWTCFGLDCPVILVDCETLSVCVSFYTSLVLFYGMSKCFGY